MKGWKLGPWAEGGLSGLVVLLAIGVSGAVGIYQSFEAIKQELRLALIRAARTAATTVDGDRHQTFRSRAQERTEAYARALVPLRRVLRANPDVRFVYTMVAIDGQPHFVLDPTAPGDRNADGLEEKSHILDPYPNPTPALMRALLRGQASANTEPYTDPWGRFISGYAPIHDSAGRQVGIVGIDLNADRYLERLAGLRWIALISGLVTLALAALVCVAVASLRRSAQRAVAERLAAADAIEEQSLYLSALLENSPVAIVVLDRQQRIQLCNPAFERLFLYRQDEIVGADLDPLITSAEQHSEATGLTETTAQGNSAHRITQRMRKDGSMVDVEIYGVPLEIGGELVGVYGLYQDITDRRRAEREQRDANRALQQWSQKLERMNVEMKLHSEMNDLLQTCRSLDEAFKVAGRYGHRLFPSDCGAIYVISHSRTVVEAVSTWGDPAPEITVFGPEDCWALRRGRTHVVEEATVGLSCGHLAPAERGGSLCVPMMAHGEAIGMLHLRSQPAESLDALAPAALPEAKQRLAHTVAEHIALAFANLRLRETLRVQSVRDPLTGLFNRRYMEESLERELRRSARHHRQLAVLFLDLDHFKTFNDTFGHGAGDTLLRELGHFLQTHVRGEDIACRYGGEEFALILPDTESASTLRRADELREQVRSIQVDHHGHSLGAVSISIGIALYPDHGSSSEQLMAAADDALYQAKARGRNRVEMAETATRPARSARLTQVKTGTN